MYKPTVPLVVKPQNGEKRPLFIGTILSGRMEAVGVASGKFRGKTQNGNIVAYFDPLGDKKSKRRKK